MKKLARSSKRRRGLSRTDEARMLEASFVELFPLGRSAARRELDANRVRGVAIVEPAASRTHKKGKEWTPAPVRMAWTPKGASDDDG